MRRFVGVAILLVVGMAGCSGEDPFDTGPTRSAAPEALGVTTDTVESAGAPVAKQEEPKPEPKREKAQAGVTGRGNYRGIGTTAAATYVRVQEKLDFLQVDQALSFYKASTGELPKTHEEFMEKVIKANQIHLPELRPGDKYVYDPEKGQLMVEKQVKQ